MTHNRWTERMLLALIFSLVLIGCSPIPPALTPPPTPTPGPLDLIKALEVADDQNDADAVMALFVDEGLYFKTPGWTATDKETLRWWFDALHLVQEADNVDCQQQGETVTCTLVARGICYQAEGIEVVHLPATFRFEDHKIRSMVCSYIPEEGQIVAAGAAKIDSWSAVNRPDEYRKYTNPAAAGLTGRQYGELYAGLCRDYLEATAE
ncbi:MAG TPA: hypothetical protein VM537_33205 [Anaerolineae bacterium]|nr:hypothetical protein [Anaerolineae bacterium]